MKKYYSNFGTWELNATKLGWVHVHDDLVVCDSDDECIGEWDDELASGWLNEPTFVLKHEIHTKKDVEQHRLLVTYKDTVQAIFKSDQCDSKQSMEIAAHEYITTHGYLAEWYYQIKQLGGIKWNEDGTSNRPSWVPEMKVEDLSFIVQ
jgi:hypothetical protein